MPGPRGLVLLVASSEDVASLNIRDRVLAFGGWSDSGTFDGSPAWRRGDFLLVTLRELHLYVDGMDRRSADHLDFRPQVVVYLSKHRAASGQDSLTVHPIGNWRDADLGGRAREVVPSAPGLMTDALRRLALAGKGSGYPGTFESTHHGPYLETPTFYIEVGSSPASWADEKAAAILANALLAAKDPGDPVALGIGGGHYMPRVTDLALTHRVSFGHLIPSYALEPPDYPALERGIEMTPGVKFAYFHRKALSKPLLRDLESFFRDRGLETAREADFAPLLESPDQSL